MSLKHANYTTTTNPSASSPSASPSLHDTNNPIPIPIPIPNTSTDPISIPVSLNSTTNIIQNTEPHPRNPRIHRPPNDILVLTDNDASASDTDNDTRTVSGKLGALKRTAYHMLSKTAHPPKASIPGVDKADGGMGQERGIEDRDERGGGGGSINIADTHSGSGPYSRPSSHSHLHNHTPRRRFTSMPQPLHPSPSTYPTTSRDPTDPSSADYIQFAAHRLKNTSPPIVDFTRFEDTYRGPRNGTFEGLLVAKSTGSSAWKNPNLNTANPSRLNSDLKDRLRGTTSRVSNTPTSPSRTASKTSNSTLNTRIRTNSRKFSRQRHRSSTSTHLTNQKMRRNTPSSLSTGLESHIPHTPQSAASRKPDPRSILVALREIEAEDVSTGLIPPREKGVETYFTTRELLEMHYLDQVDFEEREMVRHKLAMTGKLEVDGRKGDLVVMGESVRRASIYASSTMILGGREHELPIIVISCIEELYRTGIYQPNLFRALPNRTRLMQLISIFDSEKQPPGSIIRHRSHPRTSRHISTTSTSNTPSSSHIASKSRTTSTTKPNDPDYPGNTTSSNGTATDADTSRFGFGAATSLHLESMPDICALLSTYISSLPEPILSPFLFRAIWDLCEIDIDEGVSPHIPSERPPISGLPHTPTTPTPHTPSSTNNANTPPTLPHMHRTVTYTSTSTHTSTHTSPLSSRRILTAQLLLHLLPSPNFSLLVYFLAFFSQAALVREENGVGIEDLAKMFGGKIFGGGNIRVSDNNTTGTGTGSTSGGMIDKSSTITNIGTGTNVNENEMASNGAETASSEQLQFNTAHNARRPSDASSTKPQPRRPSITTGVLPSPETRREGEIMMCWFLRRWGPISDGLFEVLTNLGIDIDDEDKDGEVEIEGDDMEMEVVLSDDGLPPGQKTRVSRYSEMLDDEGMNIKPTGNKSHNSSTRSSSSESDYSSSLSPKATPTLPKFLRRDTFGRIPLPQDWFDRLSMVSTTKSLSRSMSKTRSRSLSLPRGLLSLSRSRSKSPPVDEAHIHLATQMHLTPSNESAVLDVLNDPEIVHARPQGRTRFQLATADMKRDGRGKSRSRAASALPYVYTSTSSKSPKEGDVDGRRERASQRGAERSRDKKAKYKSKFVSDGIQMPSAQMLEEMDIVDDYVMLSLEDPTSSVKHKNHDAPVPVPPRVDSRLLDSFLRNELDISNTSPPASSFEEVGPFSPVSESPAPDAALDAKEVPETYTQPDVLSIPVPSAPTSSLSSLPYKSPPLINPIKPKYDDSANINLNVDTETGSLPTVHLIPPTPKPPIHSPSTPSPTQPSSNPQPSSIPNASSPASPTPTRLRATIHLILLQNQLKRRTDALRRALTSSSKYFLRSSYLEERVRELEAWIEQHSSECDRVELGASGSAIVGQDASSRTKEVDGRVKKRDQSGIGSGYVAIASSRGDGSGGSRSQERGRQPDILKYDAYGRPREPSNGLYTRAVRPVDLQAMHDRRDTQGPRSKSAGYDGMGVVGHGKDDSRSEKARKWIN